MRKRKKKADKLLPYYLIGMLLVGSSGVDQGGQIFAFLIVLGGLSFLWRKQIYKLYKVSKPHLKKWLRIYSYNRKTLHEIDKMTGVQFEEFLQQLFIAMGYISTITKKSGDYGADLVIKKGRKKICVQAKRYNNNIGVPAIQQVHTAIRHYKANEGWVVTNQGFTLNAKSLAKSNNVKLIDRQKLNSLINRVDTSRRIKIPFLINRNG